MNADPRLGPFVRWPRAADAVLAAAITVFTVLLLDGSGDPVGLRGLSETPLPARAAFLVAGVALLWRRQQPITVLLVVLGGWTAALGSDYADLGWMAILALYSVGRWAHPGRWTIFGVTAAVVIVTVDVLLSSAPLSQVPFGGVVMVAAWDVGRRLRLGEERAIALVGERAAEAQRIVAEERTRIARELHDIVAHRVSSMTVQAGAARAVAAVDLAAALRAMGAVEEAGRQALDELRQLLGVLRLEQDGSGRVPQPELADVVQLVEEARGAGLDVGFAPDVMPNDLSAPVQLSAYRIVQEGLTNVLKHAGPGTTAEVVLEARGRRLHVEVSDNGQGHRALRPTTGVGSGHGIVGMRERAQLLGGTLRVGPQPGGGYRITADLPLGVTETV